MGDFYDLFRKTADAERPLTVVPPPTEGGNSYALAALRSEAATVAQAANGTRNDTLNRAAYRMGRHIGAGSIDHETVRRTLTDAARVAGLPDDEIATVLRDNENGALGQGTTIPRHPDPLPAPPQVTVLEVPDLAPEVTDAFWAQRPRLQHLHDTAKARRVSPWAVLGVTLARVATATPYHVVIPPVVGSKASLNLFVGLVGRSGTGKGAAEAVAADAIHVGHITTHKTGSGEGIAHGYKRRNRGELEWLDDTHAVLFSVPEIDTLSALGNRQGATLMPELRSAWSGELLGFGYADPAKRIPIEAHQYRLCLIAGIQPTRAQALLDDTDGGTPQRFLWMPAEDPDAPATTPPCPEPVTWQRPDTGTRSPLVGPGGLIYLDVCDEARNTVDQAALDRLRGATDALDGHGLLTRLKVAAALGLLEERIGVNTEDWHLAGLVMQKSDATRTHVQAALSHAAQSRNTARAEAEGKRALIVAETVEDAAIKRVSRAVVRKLRQVDDWTAAGLIRKALAGRDRGWFEEAITRLADAGQIESEETAHAVRYRLTEGRSK